MAIPKLLPNDISIMLSKSLKFIMVGDSEFPNTVGPKTMTSPLLDNTAE